MLVADKKKKEEGTGFGFDKIVQKNRSVPTIYSRTWGRQWQIWEKDLLCRPKALEMMNFVEFLSLKFSNLTTPVLCRTFLPSTLF